LLELIKDNYTSENLSEIEGKFIAILNKLDKNNRAILDSIEKEKDLIDKLEIFFDKCKGDFVTEIAKYMILTICKKF